MKKHVWIVEVKFSDEGDYWPCNGTMRFTRRAARTAAFYWKQDYANAGDKVRVRKYVRVEQ